MPPSPRTGDSSPTNPTSLDGLVQIYVRRLPDGAGKTLVSSAGARWPVWGSDGRLYFWDTSNRRFAGANVTDHDGHPVAGPQVPVLTADVERALLDRIVVSVNGARFDLDPDSGRLLVLESPNAGELPPLDQPVLLTGWPERLAKHTP